MKLILIAWMFFFAKEQIISADHERDSGIVFTSVPVHRIAIDSVFQYNVKAIDSFGKALIFSVTDLPEWLRFDAAKQSLTGKASKLGQYPIRLTVTNGQVTAEQFFMLTVFDGHTRNIVCLGNSITNGTGQYNSYRRPLWKLLHESEYNFDLMGSWHQHHMGGEVPDPDFDTDHDGHSGWTIENIFHPPDWDSARGNIDRWLEIYSPDIVLIELGTNDVFQCRPVETMMDDLARLVKVIRNKNNAVKILVGQVPPLGNEWAPKKLCGNDKSYDEVIKTLNKQISSFAGKMTSRKSTVIVVDQYTGVNPSMDMYDDIHPNTKGEELMAKRWFEALRPFLKKI